MRTRIVCLAALLCLLSASSWAAPISPNIVANDFNFTYGIVSYSPTTHILSGSATNAVMTFQPSLTGSAHPVFNLSNAPGASISLQALFDCASTNAAVDGLFKTTGADCDLVLTGKLPDLGIVPGGAYTGALLTARLDLLEMFGNAADSTQSLNAVFTILGGDLVTAGYMRAGDQLAMRSWLTGLIPTPAGNDVFSTPFVATAHIGELGTTPEPATMSLGILALGAVAAARRRMKNR